MPHIDNHYELREMLWPILSTVQYTADDIRGILESPHFDEDYKMAWHPNLTTENVDELRKAAEKLSEIFDRLKKRPDSTE